ncbi:hypothetical protein ARMSODRAFT_209041 [Armillaria solidipes]|uniref:Secreted protein n=1 Tax=Armillaria solidipes TaxID=1076256 RepID=A0A2H3BW83_9AGAR|nr:hypothetical protein ARMSODRAFT_209041 [Armillaria solidipes]
MHRGWGACSVALVGLCDSLARCLPMYDHVVQVEGEPKNYEERLLTAGSREGQKFRVIRRLFWTSRFVFDILATTTSVNSDAFVHPPAAKFLVRGTSPRRVVYLDDTFSFPNTSSF